ncbi:MAG: hypothetical protein FVQ82_16530 [Planctomycetes bacterium]|nr:hypothetical protein [Planctomycetota bacterium]
MNKEQMREMFLEVIDNQITNNDPPETKQTLDRLVSESIPEKEAKELIGCVVISEVFEVLKNEKEFDLSRYIAALNKLPQQPE